MSLAAGGPNSTAVDYILATAPLLTVALLTYIARMIRRFLGEHAWLMETTRQHGEEIASNTKAIKRMLDQREKIIEQRGRKRR